MIFNTRKQKRIIDIAITVTLDFFLKMILYISKLLTTLLPNKTL